MALNDVITNYDPTKLTVDPNDGAVTVVFTYAARDAAGQYDPTPATVTMPFSQIGLSGTVLDDADGSQVQNCPARARHQCRCRLACTSTCWMASNTVVATTTVNPNGTYNFGNVSPNTDYVLQLTTNHGHGG